MTELLSLAALCVSADMGDPHAVVALDSAGPRTRDELRRRAAAWATTLSRFVGRDWALNTPDGFECLAMIFGAWAAGCTPWLPADGVAGTVAALRTHVDGFAGVFEGVECIENPDENPNAAVPQPPGSNRRLVVFTSGSSGFPVAITKTMAQLDAEVQALHACWGARVGTAPVVASVPHRHLYGLLFKLLWPLARGAPFLSHSLGYPEEVLNALQREPCVWVSSPALLTRLPPGLDWRPARSMLRAVFSSGGPLEGAAARLVRTLLGGSAVEVYGSSETGGIAAREQNGDAARWRTLPGVEIACCNAEQTLLVRSPWTQDAGWWQTADRARIFYDGSFELLGRADRIAKVEENRVSLDAVERALLADPRVADARVVQTADGRVGAVVVPRGFVPGAGSATRALGTALRVGLAPFVEPVALPRRWRFVDALPRDALGKCTYTACATLLDAARSAPREPQILEETGRCNACLLRLRIDPALAWFDGHFPNNPVLPGVVQVHWVVRLARARFALGARFAGMEKLKFQLIIGPGMEVKLELIHDPENGRLEFVYRSAQGTHSSGRLLFPD